MWRIENRTPFAVGQGWTRDLRGAHTWIVVVKATFIIARDGSTEMAEEQPPVVRIPIYRGEPGQSSLRLEHDFVLEKSATDLIVDGLAYAPLGRPATQIEVGLRAGSLTKVLSVTGDRVWKGGARMITDPMPFLTMPVTYERAFGGTDPNAADPAVGQYWPNPVGTGFTTSRDNTTDMRLPNIEYGDDTVGGWNDRPRPAGFGPIAPHWESRATLAGTYDRAWQETRQPLAPHDFDTRYWQCAPDDQQVRGFLRGGEPVVLTNLTASGTLRFALPILQLSLETRFTNGDRVHHEPAVLHTVIIEPEAPRLSLVWQSALECHRRMEHLDRTEVDGAIQSLSR